MCLVDVALGLVVGLMFAALSLLGGPPTARATGPGFGAVFGVAAIIIMPILYGCIGFVMTLILAAVYNWAAGVVGGIEIQTDQVDGSLASRGGA
jgi:hypothetical protein